LGTRSPGAPFRPGAAGGRPNAVRQLISSLRPVTTAFFGKTARRFALPQELDETRANAKFADGVLNLTLPKKAVVTGRKLEIN
jgi:hypothetical protein